MSERKTHERLDAFRRGFEDGALAMGPAFTLEPDYLRGHEAGYRARGTALVEYAAEVGFDAARSVMRDRSGS